MPRFIRLFGRGCIKCLVADREFVGHEWFKWLNDNAIQYHIRIWDNFWVEDSRAGEKIGARHIFNNLKHEEERALHHIYRVCGELCYLSGAMIKDKVGETEARRSLYPSATPRKPFLLTRKDEPLKRCSRV